MGVERGRECLAGILNSQRGAEGLVTCRGFRRSGPRAVQKTQPQHDSVASAFGEARSVTLGVQRRLHDLGHVVTAAKVKLSIDGRTIATLHASRHGSVRYRINPSALGLPPGRHAVDLASMLITTTNTFHYR
jgi:hypothetical protein